MGKRRNGAGSRGIDKNAGSYNHKREMRKILFFVFWKPEFNKDTELFSQIEDSGKKLNTVLFLFMEKITQENIMCL